MEVDPDFVKKLFESFFVDDFVGGGASSEEVTDLYSKTRRRMLDGGFELRKWLKNDASVRRKIESDSSDLVTQDAVTEKYVTNDATVSKIETTLSAEVVDTASFRRGNQSRKIICRHADGVQGPGGAGFNFVL